MYKCIGIYSIDVYYRGDYNEKLKVRTIIIGRMGRIMGYINMFRDIDILKFNGKLIALFSWTFYKYNINSILK